MNFKFQFPTLKHLAMLTLGSRWINERPIGQQLMNFLSEECLEEVHQLVRHTGLPLLLQPEFIHVLTGLHYNVARWKCVVDENLLNLKINEFVFDVHGQLDDAQTYDKYFDTKLGSIQNPQELVGLLEAALKESLLPQINKVLKNLVLLADEGKKQTLLDEPRHEISNDNHILVYRFKEKPNAQAASNLALWLNCCSFLLTCNEHIVFRLGEFSFSFLSFQHHYNLLDESRRESYIQDTISTLLSYNKMSIVVNILQCLNAECQTLLRKRCLRLFLLKRFLDWPYNQFFLLMLRDLNADLSKWDCSMLFVSLVARIPFEERHETGYADQLLAFFNSLSSEMKQTFLEDTTIVKSDNEYLITKMLLLCHKNPGLHDKVLNTLSSARDHV